MAVTALTRGLRGGFEAADLDREIPATVRLQAVIDFVRYDFVRREGRLKA